MERIYKSMKFSGASSIALGVVIICVGVVCGILAIINGAKLLKDKSNITF
jgi:hypothetical protein